VPYGVVLVRVLCARILCYRCIDPIPSNEGGGNCSPAPLWHIVAVRQNRHLSSPSGRVHAPPVAPSASAKLPTVFTHSSATPELGLCEDTGSSRGCWHLPGHDTARTRAWAS